MLIMKILNGSTTLSFIIFKISTFNGLTTAFHDFITLVFRCMRYVSVIASPSLTFLLSKEETDRQTERREGDYFSMIKFN